MTVRTGRLIRTRVSHLALAVVVAGLSLGGGSLHAAVPRVFRLPPEPVDDAVVRFAVQGDVSVGGFPAPGCNGRSRVTVGLMTPAEALRRLLPPGCAFEMVGPRAFRVIAQPPAGLAHAAPDAGQADAEASLDVVVVTAERRIEPLAGSAFPASVITGAELLRLGGRSFSDIALQIAGVTVTNLGSGRDKIFVRGLSDGSFTGKTQSTVGLYLDDVPITYSAPDPDLRLADVDRVEVLRGPQGTLYGSGSIGGIVRIVTAKPDPSGFAAAVTVEGAAAWRGAGSSGGEAMLNVPLGHLPAAVRLVAYRDDHGGYIDNVRLGFSDVNHSRRSGVRASVLANLPAGWRAQVGYAHQSINTDDSQYVQGPSAGLFRDNPVREPHDNDLTELSASLARDGEAVDLKISTAYIEHGLKTRYDATDALGAVGPAAFDEGRQVHLWVAEAQLSSIGGGAAHWLAGMFVSRADETDDGLLSDPATGHPSQSVYRRRDRLSEGAVYGEYSYDITSRVTATAGGRLFTNHQTSHMGGFDLARTPVGMPSGELDGRGFTPKFRLSYSPRPDMVVYAQVQEGYRTGGFNLPGVADGTTPAGVASPQFRPDRLRSYEVGAEAPLWNRAITLRAAIFHAGWRSLQTDQYLASGLPMTVNIGDGSNTGLEIEGRWRPDSHLQLRGALLLEDPQITRTSDSFPARVDIGLPGAPAFMGSADLRYRWSLRAGLEAQVSAQVAYVGHSFVTFDGASASRMGGYGVGHIGAQLDSLSWRLQAYIDNVTDETGDTFAFGDPFSRVRATQTTPLRPRTFAMALTRRF
jgi:outer membrane receptor protein involved in Fe transport